MNLYLFYDENIISFSLPSKKIGNFWMTNDLGKNIVNINGEDDNWVISGSENTKVIASGNEDEKIILQPKNYYIVKDNKKEYILYCDNTFKETIKSYEVANDSVIKVGKSMENELAINLQYLNDLEYELKHTNNIWEIKKTEKAHIYLNDELITDEIIHARNGDIINVYGFMVILANNCIFAYAPYNLEISSKLTGKEFLVNDELTSEEIENENMYKEDDYYLRSPRMRRAVQNTDYNIDPPPTKENMQEMPLIMTLAPMLTMAASSMITLSTTIQSINEGKSTVKQSLPSLIITISMILSMLVWPFVTRKYEKYQKKKREQKRQKRYKEYLDRKRQELTAEYANQVKILNENLLATNVCYDAIINKRRSLWARRLDQEDFLSVRIGKGQVPFGLRINYKFDDFKMDENDDNLKQMLESLIKDFQIINDVPIEYSFTKNHLTAINGINPKYYSFMNNLLLQMMSYHSYEDLKIAIFTNKKNAKKWDYMKDSPYCFSNDKSIRFFATNTEEMQELSEYLKPRFNGRQEANGYNSVENDFSKYASYYLIIVDDIKAARKIGVIDDILEERRNLGFSLVVLEEKLSKIPSEISKFITIGESVSAVINSDNNDQIRFNDEISNDFDMYAVSKTLMNLPIYFDSGSAQLPNTITFLELFGVGQIDQLNVLNRWKAHNPIKSLKTEIGVNENCDPFILDIHEKYHGPHGLIAGMTGSGKSEFIITYVLSMAVNYSPEEVAFVLIDYKGGGLAGAFVNNETGQKLPHVVGTITNLDKAEINRALSSIQSELRRRQAKFNEVRDKLGESTIDIYKYQQLYRDGVVREPIPHLIIVCDEFAELKDQQPDFMDDLISTARIGRSLGVHLILATQKPSGVVDAQIWSNSKFKICLKVQDKSDSNEMIKNDLAAELKNVGRFYLQVGYNEFFALGQAAWAGAQYYPRKEYKKVVDKNLYFISNTGSIRESINNAQMRNVKSEGEELTNIVKYLIGINKESDFNLKQLWLDRIPNNILLKDLFKKYNYAKEDYNINPVIGEYDDPMNQMQGLLTLQITNSGNTIIYGTNDSGKDELLTSLVYSMIYTYATSELNIYIMDFGAETLMNFQDAPQVGNVILNGEDEKMENLVKMLNTELEKRKKLFMSYNGNYTDYVKLSGKKLPNIVVIINAIEVLNEVNYDYLDYIAPIIREGSKYGINFIITTINQSSVKFKIAQSCKQLMCLQMNDESDYRDILGKTNGIIPTSCLGRGLIKLDRVVEFQTAFITNQDNSFLAIKDLISVLTKKGLNKARTIPTMPDTILIDRFLDKYLGITTVPIGLNKETLNASLYDFSKSAATLVTSNDFNGMNGFIKNYSKVLEKNDTFNKVIVDACNYFEDYNLNINFFNSNFDKLVDQIKNINDKLQDYLQKNNMNLRSLKDVKNNLIVIVGFNKFMSKLDEEHKELFSSILTSQKEILKINFVFIDGIAGFKDYEYEEWFKDCVDTNNGIWIGAGVTQQYTLQLNSQPVTLNTVDEKHGVIIKNGVPIIIKVINEIK